MSAKRLSMLSLALAFLTVLVIGLIELGGTNTASVPSTLTLAEMRTRLAGSPPALASLHAQGSEVLAGGLAALRARLAQLGGTPVVINKWASWCAPCRAEFGVFQRVSVSEGHRVAFIGIDSNDTSRADALAFLRSFPVSYPSYFDQSGQAGVAITDSTFTPVTVFYDTHASQFIHQGPYLSTAKLEADIRRYALDS
jgi:thiol-disulfide isomerase/thioredoxin